MIKLEFSLLTGSQKFFWLNFFLTITERATINQTNVPFHVVNKLPAVLNGHISCNKVITIGKNNVLSNKKSLMDDFLGSPFLNKKGLHLFRFVFSYYAHKKRTNNKDFIDKGLIIINNFVSDDLRKKVINEAKEIMDVENVIASILLVEDLRIQKN